MSEFIVHSIPGSPFGRAVLATLEEKGASWRFTPADPKAAARMDQAMNVNDWYLFQGVANVIVFHRVVGPRGMGLQPDEAAISAAMPRAQMVFDELSRLLGDQAYFT